MSEVISLQQAREERSPHWSGPCKCLGCGHEWHGVGPVGTHIVECPDCELMKGHVKFLFGPDTGDQFFMCNCGSEGLTAYIRKGRFRIVCLACGVDHTDALYE